MFFPVLHPRHKLEYFRRAGWEPEWIETASEIVRTKFEESYAVPVERDDGEGLPAARGPNTKSVRQIQPYHPKLT